MLEEGFDVLSSPSDGHGTSLVLVGNGIELDAVIRPSDSDRRTNRIGSAEAVFDQIEIKRSSLAGVVVQIGDELTDGVTGASYRVTQKKDQPHQAFVLLFCETA